MILHSMEYRVTAKGTWSIVVVLLAASAIPAEAERRLLATTSAPTSKASTASGTTKSGATKTAQRKKIASTAKRGAKSAPVDPTVGDDPSRDQPLVRAAAIEALGSRMGSVVVVDPFSGKILTIVNQKLALGPGHQPCSVFKPAVALAALGEGLIENDHNRLKLGKKWYLDLGKSLAISNNVYFARLGELLGLDKMREYATWFGLGELAGWGLTGEPRGGFPSKAPPARRGGVGKLASFGEGISLTPLQLASFISAVANGGTLYYLQYPETQTDVSFEPKVKRQLEIAPWLSPIRQGMEEAVLSGTAKRARQPDMKILGKTGTCSQDRVRLGWFGSYSQMEGGLAVVVFLRGGAASGSQAAEVAGHFFRTLTDRQYFAKSQRENLPSPPAAIFDVAPVR